MILADVIVDAWPALTVAFLAGCQWIQLNYRLGAIEKRLDSMDKKGK